MTTVITKITRFLYKFRFISMSFLIIFFATESFAQVAQVDIVTDEGGSKLQVDGMDFMVLGMNWDYFPIGKTYTYSFWTQPDSFITAALDYEMSLLKNMGVNAIRQYVGVTPRWVKYIYENYGIYTVLNHSFGRYGVTLDGVYIENTDYKDPRTRELLISEVEDMVNAFKDTPGVLMWLLGNENNYGLFWGGAETEDIPEGETLESVRARHMYKLFNEGVKAIQALDTKRPVAICNGDLLFIDIIAEEVTDLDIIGTNMYRGVSFGDAFEKVKEKLDVPIFFTEFGADAWNARTMREDQVSQAYYMVGNWQEIYEQTSGKGLVGNSIGGLTFQWSDGWWKYLQDSNLDIHDVNASWSNGGYRSDYVEGENNMNEEWFGVCAKGPTDILGRYELYPRAAFYALQEVNMLDPYAPGTDLETIRAHFKAIEPMSSMLQARGDEAKRVAESLSLVKVSNVRMEFETYNTGGSKISTPSDEEPQPELPAFLGFDHQQSFYADFEMHPAGNVHGTLSINVLGNVGVNRIDEIFYENRGRRQTIIVDGEPLPLDDLERVKVYNASISWGASWFSLKGFYRIGHTHWGYEGDFFGIYRNAYYGENLDIYNGIAPIGAEISLKKALEGLKIVFGPELHWGANPAFILKYRRKFGNIGLTALYQNEFAQRRESVSSFVVPRPATKRATLSLETKFGSFGLTIGGIWAGEALVGEAYQVLQVTNGDTTIQQAKVEDEDTFGGKAKLTFQSGAWNWYAQWSYAGIVATGGPDATRTFTGWVLKDHGAGNGNTFLTGLAYNIGDFQISPNFMWQKPLVGPIPGDAPAPGRPRNVISDPFAVRESREAIAGELLLTFDPAPADWMWEWDNDVQESAPIAWSLGFIYRHYPTTMDAAIGILQDGRTFFAFPGATPARDLWEVSARIVSRISESSRLVMNLFAGTGEPNGDDTRLIHRYGGDARLTVGSWAFATFAKFGDWGPYDYHRDFNLTFPAHLMLDISYSLGLSKWFGLPQTSIGVRGLWRSLNQYSNRYCPIKEIDASGTTSCNPDAPGYSDGDEWEIRTYLHFSI